MAESIESDGHVNSIRPVTRLGLQSSEFYASGGSAQNSVPSGCGIHDSSFSSDTTGSDFSLDAHKHWRNITLSASSSDVEENGGTVICEICSKPRPLTPHPEHSDDDVESEDSSASSIDYDDMILYHMVMDNLSQLQQEADEEDTEADDSWLEAERFVGQGGPLYPHRAMRFSECEVCLVEGLLRRRVCCDFKICDQCLNKYIELRIVEARLQVECPNDRCKVLVSVDEIKVRLSSQMREKYDKFLVDANADPCKKTCPGCSITHTIDPDVLTARRKLKKGLRVKCRQCRLEWCFLCQAPFHTDLSCKQFRKGDEMVRQWAKEKHHGHQNNAQRCPKCKVFIQKIHGCDHMKCNQCNTDFCYNCGDRYIHLKFLGNHWSRFSVFGCKHRLLPHKPVLRRLIRGANFAARLMAGTVLAGLGLAAGVVLVGASVIILPGYGIVRLRRKMSRRKKTIALHVTEVGPAFATNHGARDVQQEENEMEEVEEIEVVGDEEEEVHVTVHPEPAASLCQCFENPHTDLRVQGGLDGGAQLSADVKETLTGTGGYSTVVASFVSRVVEGACTGAEDEAVDSPMQEDEALLNVTDRNSLKAPHSMDTTSKEEITNSDVPLANEDTSTHMRTGENEEESCCEERFVTLPRSGSDMLSESEHQSGDTTKTDNCPQATTDLTEACSAPGLYRKVSFDKDSSMDEDGFDYSTEEERMLAQEHKAGVMHKNEKCKRPMEVAAKAPAMAKDEGELQPPTEDENVLVKDDCRLPVKEEGRRQVRDEDKSCGMKEDSRAHTNRDDGAKLSTKSTAGLNKDSPNGCFGNIFSTTKRSSSLQSQDSPNKTWSQISRAAHKKSATWEKMQRGKMESLLIGRCSLLDTGHPAVPGQRSLPVSGSSLKLERSNSEVMGQGDVRDGLVGDTGHVGMDVADHCKDWPTGDSSLYDDNGFYISQHTISTYL